MDTFSVGLTIVIAFALGAIWGLTHQPAVYRSSLVKPTIHTEAGL